MLSSTPSSSRRTALVGGIAALMAAISIALLIVRWSVTPPRAVTLDLGDPATSASHFFAPERSDTLGFRWSKSTSAISLPAMASSQVLSITLNPARPQGAPPTHFRLSVGTQELGSYEAASGWNTYTATVGPGFGPDVRLIVDSETFYPGVADRRRLGVAVASVSTAPTPGRTGLQLPPFLWLVAGVILPACAVVLSARRSLYFGVVIGVGSALLPTILALFLPTLLALPLVAWLGGLALAGTLLYYLLGHWAPALNTKFQSVGEGGPGWKELGWVALLVGGLAVVFTWPLVTRLGVAMPGWPADNFAFLYKLWWFRTALLERGVWPLFDPNSYAPYGFDLGQGEPTLANTLPGVLIGAASNDVVSYNVLILLSFVVSGLGAYLLAREVTGNRGAALAAAIAFAFCPYRMAQIAGHIQLVGTGWIALTFYFLERTLKTRRLRDGALLGLMLSLTALSAWYYAYMVGLALGLYTLVRLWQMRRRDTQPADEAGPSRPWPSVGMPLLVGAAVFLLLGGVAAIPSLRLWAQGGLSHSAKAADEHSAAPLDYVIPNQLHPLWGEPFMRAHAEQNIIESNLYIGAVAAMVIALGFAVRARTQVARLRAASAWLTLLVAAGVLSLGLTLHDARGQVQFPFGPLSLPGRLLFDWFPFYSSMRAYARWGVIVALAVAVLLAVALSYILARWPRQAGRIALAVTLLLLVDLWTAPYSWATSRVEPTETARFLAAQSQPGLVMQMPLAASQSGPLLFQGVYYGEGKPVAYGYDTFEPEPWREARPTLETFPDERALELLGEWGVRYVVVSANAYKADWPSTLDYLRSLPRLKHLATINEHRTWDVDPAVLDAQPELLQYFEPDTQAVFELLR